MRLAVAAAIALTLFVIPGTAGAAVTSTNITSPTDGAYVLWDDRIETGTATIEGTAPGALNGDLVDIRCYSFGGYSWPAAENVPVNGGQFSHSDLSSISGTLCKLRAVPAGTEPGDLTLFTGPTVEIHEIYVQRDNPYDSDNLKANDFDVRVGQFVGRMDWAAGKCTLDSELADSAALERTPEVFSCTHRLHGLNDEPTRSPIQIDGKNGWLTSNLVGSAYENEPNFPGLTVDPTINLTNGNAIVNATEDVITCTNDTAEWWEPGQECPPIIGTGVRLDRRISQTKQGKKGLVRDRWTSTDGQSHTISLRYREAFGFADSGSPGARYVFPGLSPIENPTDGSSVPGPLAAGTTIFAYDPAYADGSTEVGRAAIKLVSGADSAEFAADGFSAPSIVLGYENRTIPAGGYLEVTTEFYQDHSQAGLEALIAATPDAEDIDTTEPPTRPISDNVAKPTITGKLGVRTSASRGKRPRVTVSTNRAVNCPAGGAACKATVALSTKVKVRSGRKTRTKTVKLGNFSFAIPAGSSKKLSFKLAAKHTKLFRANRSLKLSALISASAGSGAAVLATDTYTAKRPRFKKK